MSNGEHGAPPSEREPPPPNIYGPGSGCARLCLHGIDQRSCTPTRTRGGRRLYGVVHGLIFPGSHWDTPVGRTVASQEAARAWLYYRNDYCISLDFLEVTLTPRATRDAKAWWEAWYADAVVAIGGAHHFYRSSLPGALINRFHDGAVAIQNAIQRAHPEVKLLIVWMDYYIGQSDHRDTLCSSNQHEFAQIGMDWLDRGSPYMLSHELIHALGKRGPGTPGHVTWGHDSPCQNALSTVTRRIGQTQDLSGRFLEFDELQEIVTNRGGGVLHT